MYVPAALSTVVVVVEGTFILPVAWIASLSVVVPPFFAVPKK